MNVTDQDPQVVAAELAPVVAMVEQALRVGTAEARSYFQSIARSVDPFLFPSIVRYHAKLALRDMEIDLVPLANNGLLLSSGGYMVRVLKADQGEPPAPGASRLKQAFYNQQLRLWPDESAEEPKGNLILVWDVDMSFELDTFSLACPRGGGANRSTVDLSWNQPIPLMFGRNDGSISRPPAPEDLEIALRSDDIAETGTE